MNTMQDFITNGIRESCYRFQRRVAGSESEHACQKHFAVQLREWSDNVEIEAWMPELLLVDWDDWFSDSRYSLRFILYNFLVNIYSSEAVPW